MGPRPGAAQCIACKGIFPYVDMVKVRRQWWCTNRARESANEDKEGCKERMERFGFWPPAESQQVKDNPEPGFETVK